MRAELDHRTARIETSARWDGEHDPALFSLVEAHVATCPECRAELEKMSSARQALRLQTASTPPDLAPSIIRKLGAVPVRRLRTPWRERLTAAAVAAAISALLIAGTSLPWDDSSDLAGAAEVSLEIRRAARELGSYSASYSLTETGWHEQVPVRTFSATVDFKAPERLRVRISDTTSYPSLAWPRNDVELAASPRRWWIREPSSCPPEALPGCAVRGFETRALSSRAPFDGDTLPPTDIVVPLESLASSGGFRVAGAETLEARDVYRLELDHLAAEPLIAALQPGGSWARFAPDDPATIWIDRETWFPVAIEVESVSSKARFEARLTQLRDAPRLGVVPKRAMVSNRGDFRDGAIEAAWAPSYTAGLEPYRSGRGTGTALVSYASGLTWLKVARDAAPRSAAAISEEVPVGEGTGYYLPADARGSRRLDLFTDGTRYRIEGNVARDELLRVAASMGVTGDELPGRDSVAPASFGPLRWLPRGYRPASIVKARGGSVTVYFRHPEIERAAYGVRVTHSPSRRTLTPSSEEFTLVEVDGRPARWSSERGELEWIDEGYRAVAAPGLGLGTAVRIAEGWARGS